MDVVLTNESQVLFLESKFTEYLNTTLTYKVKPYYIRAYSDAFGEQLQLDNIIFDRTSCSWKSLNGRQYLEGLKQMVCHYLGIKNCIEQKAGQIASWNVDTSDSIDKSISSKSEFFLGEVLFDFSCDEFVNYKRLHSQLVQKLSPVLVNGKRFTVINELLTYQSIFNGANARLLTQTIRNFYGLGHA